MKNPKLRETKRPSDSEAGGGPDTHFQVHALTATTYSAICCQEKDVSGLPGRQSTVASQTSGWDWTNPSVPIEIEPRPRL